MCAGCTGDMRSGQFAFCGIERTHGRHNKVPNRLTLGIPFPPNVGETPPIGFSRIPLMDTGQQS